MKNLLAAILLLACATSIAHSQPGSPAATPSGNGSFAPLCLTITQRMRLADSLAMLPRVRKAALEYRTSADIARRTVVRFDDALVAQQLRTTQAHIEANDWKGKARRRGLLNWFYTAAIVGAGYLFVKP